MKIYLAIKYHSDNQNQGLIQAILDHLARQGHTALCAVRDFENWGKKTVEPRELLTQCFQAIQDCDLVLIEASEKGMGIGIEAGFAFAQGKPVVTVAKLGSDLSINLKSLSSKTIFYLDPSEINLPEAPRGTHPVV